MGNAESTKCSIAVRTEKVSYMAGDTVRAWVVRSLGVGLVRTWGGVCMNPVASPHSTESPTFRRNFQSTGQGRRVPHGTIAYHGQWALPAGQGVGTHVLHRAAPPRQRRELTIVGILLGYGIGRCGER